MVPPLFTPLSQEGPQGVWHRQTPRAITGAPDIPYCPVMPGVQAAALGGSFTGGALPLAPNGGSLPSGDTGYFFPSSQWRLFSWMDSTPFSRLCQWFFEEREGIANIENKGQHPSLQIFFELMSRYHISVDQFLFGDTADGKSTARRQLDALADKLTDREIACGVAVLSRVALTDFSTALEREIVCILQKNQLLMLCSG